MKCKNWWAIKKVVWYVLDVFLPVFWNIVIVFYLTWLKASWRGSKQSALGPSRNETDWNSLGSYENKDRLNGHNLVFLGEEKMKLWRPSVSFLDLKEYWFLILPNFISIVIVYFRPC